MRLSRPGYYADFVVYPLAIAAMVAVGARHSDGGPARLALAACTGLALWTPLEYALHRFAFHHAPAVRELHRAHHAEPKAYIGSPAAVGLALFAALAFAPVWGLFGVVAAAGFAAGLMLGYLAYLVVHHACHHWRIPPGAPLYRLKHRHARHHFLNGDGDFGVTTALWDRVFGTALDAPPGRMTEIKSGGAHAR